MTILETSLVVDGCAFAEAGFPEDTTRLAAGGVDAVVFTVPGDGLAAAVDALGGLHRAVDARADLAVARTAAAIETNRAEGVRSFVLAFQDPRPLADRLDRLRAFYELGLRVVQLTYNKAGYVGSGCTESRDGGLTDFGRRLVRAMNELGVLVDLSHCGRRTALEAMELSERPVVFTHANARAVADNPRNRDDEELDRLAEGGGVIGLTPWGPLCWKGRSEAPPTLDDYLDHVDYVVRRIGIDHVGFGTDNTIDGAADVAGIRHQAAHYPEVVGAFDRRVGDDPAVRYARGFAGHHELPNVVRGLEARGYPPEAIAKLLGGNFLRVFREVWGG